MTDIQFLRRSLDATDSVSQAWELLRRNYWLHFGIAFVNIVGLAILGIIPLVSYFITGPVFVGLYRTYLLDLRGEPVNFGTMFSGFKKFVPAMLVGLIQAVPQIIIQAIQWTMNVGELVFGRGGLGGIRQPSIEGIWGRLPTVIIVVALAFVGFSILWSFVFFFAFQIMAEHDIGPIDAIVLSAQAVFSNLGRIILLVLMQLGIGILGALVCGIGVFFVLPVIFASSAIAYRQVFPSAVEPFDNFPPHPSAYGNQSGWGA
ncbi:MAG: hypothetical protein ABIP75_03640 [Pyrinomonadaceae bacterium]